MKLSCYRRLARRSDPGRGWLSRSDGNCRRTSSAARSHGACRISPAGFPFGAWGWRHSHPRQRRSGRLFSPCGLRRLRRTAGADRVSSGSRRAGACKCDPHPPGRWRWFPVCRNRTAYSPTPSIFRFAREAALTASPLASRPSTNGLPTVPVAPRTRIFFDISISRMSASSSGTRSGKSRGADVGCEAQPRVSSALALASVRVEPVPSEGSALVGVFLQSFGL